MLIGGAVGYVLGARAGRERYEQIQRGYARFKESKAYDQLAAQANSVGDLTRSLAATGMEASSQKLKDLATADTTIEIDTSSPIDQQT